MWRIAIAADDAPLIEMCAALNREDPGPDPVPPDHMQRTLAALRAEPARGRAVALELDGKIAGYALLISFWSNELGGEICNIDEIYVRPEYRRKGFAGALILMATKGPPIWPHRPVSIELEVTPGNYRAREFYAGFGFLPTKNSHMRLMVR